MALGGLRGALAVRGLSSDDPEVERSGCGRYVISLWFALALQGCASDVGGSCPSPPCTTAIVHLAYLDGRAAIPLEVDGKVIEVVLDTGSYDSVLTHQATTDLRGQAWAKPIEGLGVDGSTVSLPVSVRNLFLAGGHASRAVFSDMPSLRFGDPRLAGLVGGDLLGNWDLDLDISRGLLKLDLPQSRPPVPPWKGPTTIVPLEEPYDTWIRIAVMLDGREFHAILDTGAEGSVVDPGTEAEGETPQNNGLIIVSGVAGRNKRFRRHHYNDLLIGGLSFGAVDVGVGPIGLSDVNAIIGLDVLRLTRFYVAYQAHTLLIDEDAN